MADGPVLTESIVRVRFEFVVTQAKGLARPKEGPAAKQADANPVVGLLGLEGVWDFLLIDPHISVVLVGLEYVIDAAGWPEATKRKFVRMLVLSVAGHVGYRAGVQHEAAYAGLGKNLGGHAAGVSGTDDEDVPSFVGDGAIGHCRSQCC